MSVYHEPLRILEVHIASYTDLVHENSPYDSLKRQTDDIKDINKWEKRNICTCYM